MNKTQLVEKIAENADISKASAGRALDAVIEAVTETLKADEQVALVGPLQRFNTPQLPSCQPWQ